MWTSPLLQWQRIVFVAIKDASTGRHEWYEADHGIQRDPLRDAIRDCFPTSGEGWNVNDVDLRVCLFGEAIGRHRKDSGWVIEFEAKKNGAGLKWAQAEVMELMDRLAKHGDTQGKHWGGCWLLQIPDDIGSGEFRLFRPLTRQRSSCVGISGLREWIASRAPRA